MKNNNRKEPQVVAAPVRFWHLLGSVNVCPTARFNLSIPGFKARICPVVEPAAAAMESKMSPDLTTPWLITHWLLGHTGTVIIDDPVRLVAANASALELPPAVAKAFGLAATKEARVMFKNLAANSADNPAVGMTSLSGPPATHPAVAGGAAGGRQEVLSGFAVGAGIVRVCPGVMTFGLEMPLAFAMSHIPTPNFGAILPRESPGWTVTVCVPFDAAAGAGAAEALGNSTSGSIAMSRGIVNEAVPLRKCGNWEYLRLTNLFCEHIHLQIHDGELGMPRRS